MGGTWEFWASFLEPLAGTLNFIFFSGLQNRDE